MKKLVLGLLISLLMVNPVLATTTVSVTAHSAGTTALSATENTNNSNLANGINTHNAATTGEHGADGTILDSTSPTMSSPTITGTPTATGATWASLGTATVGTITTLTIGTALNLGLTNKLYLDAGSDDYIQAYQNGGVRVYCAGTNSLDVSSTTVAAIGVYANTTADAANVSVAATGIIARSTSARKYKTNERDLPYDKTKLMSLKAVIYNSKCPGDNKSKNYFGIVADDAAKIYPELVTYGADGQPEGFQYERLTAVLLKATQELQKQVDALTKRIEKLEGK